MGGRMDLSYAHGASEVVLLGETIGENLASDRRARALTRTRWSSRSRTSASPTASSTRRSTTSPRASCRSAWPRASASASGARTTPSGCCCSTPPPRIGAILVNINPAYRTHEVAYALQQSGCRMLVAATEFKAIELRRHGGGGALAAAGSRHGHLARHRGLGRPAGAGHRRVRRRAGRTGGDARLRRPDQHPVHQRHHRLPEGRDAQPPQHPQQRLLRRRGLRLHRGSTGSASRCPSTTASAWCSGTWPARRTAPRS